MSIRPLDIEDQAALVAYLREANRIGPGEQLTMRVLGGGVSNRTVRVERARGEAWVLKQALTKLRVEVDWFSNPLRVHQEAAGLRWLSQALPLGSVPALVFEDHEHHILAMEAVAEPHENWKQALLAGRLEAGHVEQFARMLATMHRKGYEQRGNTAEAFEDRSFFESLRLEPYYAFAAQQVSSADAFLSGLIEETRRSRWTVTHGDYSPKNVLVYDDRLILLDHEVIHFGDGGFDLGFSLTHFLSKAHHVVGRREAFATAAVRYWQVYRATLGDVPWADDLEPRAVRHTLACLLARVAGRSPLEYLSERERERQRNTVVALLANPPTTVGELVARFTEKIESQCPQSRS